MLAASLPNGSRRRAPAPHACLAVRMKCLALLCGRPPIMPCCAALNILDASTLSTPKIFAAQECVPFVSSACKVGYPKKIRPSHPYCFRLDGTGTFAGTKFVFAADVDAVRCVASSTPLNSAPLRYPALACPALPARCFLPPAQAKHSGTHRMHVTDDVTKAMLSCQCDDDVMSFDAIREPCRMALHGSKPLTRFQSTWTHKEGSAATAQAA